MGRLLPIDAIGTPSRWLLVFNRRASSRWTSFIALGRYKHVRCFGYVADADAYIFYDVQFGRTILAVARGDGARRLMLEWCQDADVLAIISSPSHEAAKIIVTPLLCTTAIAHLVGLPAGALRPDTLFRQCLRHGATRVSYEQSDQSDRAASASGAVRL